MSDNVTSPWTCPICFEVPTAKIFQCRRGHSICTECKLRQKNCPECQIPYKNGVTRNLALESILDKLTLDCPHKELGCKERIGREQIPQHSMTCNFRPRKCVKICRAMGFNHCNFSVKMEPTEDDLVEARDHFTNVHSYSSLTNDGGEAICYVIGGFGRLLEMDRIWPSLIVRMSDARNAPTFLIYAKYSKEDETLSWINIFLGGDMTSDSDWEAEFLLTKRDPDSDRVKKFKWKVPAISVADAEEFMDTCPVRLSVPYLLQFNMDGLYMNLRMRSSVPTQNDNDNGDIVVRNPSFYSLWMPMDRINQERILNVESAPVVSFSLPQNHY